MTLQYRIEKLYDDGHNAPWDDYDGHGPVREVRRGHHDYLRKNPGERILGGNASDRSGYAYDIAEATRIARRDAWGIDPERKARWEASQGRPLTPGQIAAAAVEADFQRLRGWVNDDWHYIGIVVTLLDIEGNDTHLSESLWGIESDSDDYIAEVTQELQNELAAQVGPANIVIESTPGRTTHCVVRA